MAGMVVEQSQRDLVERGLDRRDLRHDLDAVTVVLDHPLDATDLALDAAQPLQQLLLGCGVSARLACDGRAHAHDCSNTPGGFAMVRAVPGYPPGVFEG